MQLDVEGSRVFAARGGRALSTNRPLLVLLHGAGMDHTAWSLVARAFAHGGFSVLAPDLPGHGASQGPAPTSVAAYAEWTAAMIESAGFARANVIGHSLGSMIALELAAAAPDRVAGLGLLGTAAKMPVHPNLQAAADAGDHVTIDLMIGWSLAPAMHLGRHPTPGMSMRDAGIRLMERTSPDVIASDLRASNDYHGAIDAAGRIRCATLVVLGGRDMMTPAHNAEPLIDALPAPSVVRLPESGHLMMIEQPDAVIDAVLGFLRDH